MSLALIAVLVAGLTPACPANFDVFLSGFERSADAQRAATADRITKTWIDTEGPGEPKTMTTRPRRSALSYPLLDIPEVRKRKGLVREVRSRKPNRVEVVVFAPDTDWQMTYTFEKKRCWVLVRYDDQSL